MNPPPSNILPPDESMVNAALGSVGRSFYGEPYEDDVENPGLRDFLACHFHRKILRDSKLASTRRIGLRAANQIGKTTIAEIILKYRMKYDPGDMMMWDMSEEKSNDHMKNRAGPILRADPVLGPMFRAIMETPETRWDVTTQDIRLPGMVFRARPLNEQWTQSVFLRYGAICDAALCEPNQVRRARLRFTQHETDYLWIVESQGGVEGDGFTEWMSETNEMKLHVRCPICGTRVRFLFYHLRTDETKLVPPKDIPSLDHAAWIEHNRPILLDKDRKHAGFKVLSENLKLDDGSINEQEIMRATAYECPHCGGIWKDDNIYHAGGQVTYGPTRSYLDREAGLDESWIATRATAMPGFLGYSLPRWINPKPSWGGIMLTFRQAMAAKKLGNLMPLQEFQTKWAGEDWQPNEFLFGAKTITTGTYDPAKTKELFGDNFHSVNMAVDCQEEADHKAKTDKSITGWFWYVVRAYDKFGNSKQLARGYCKSWDAWRAVQSFWGVPNDRVIIDIVQWSEQVMNKAVEFRQLVKRNRPHPIFKTMEDSVTWKLLAASPGKQNFKGHRDGIIRPWSPEAPVYGNTIDEHGRVRRIPLARILFNKTPIQQQVDSLYSGAPGLPKFEWLALNQLQIPDADGKLVPDTLTIQMETNQKDGKPSMLAYENQMSAQIYNQETNRYDELRPDDHYYWCEQALLVRVGQDGLMGQNAVFATEENQ